MADNNENANIPPSNDSPTGSGSLLGEILSTSDAGNGVDLLSDSFIPETPAPPGEKSSEHSGQGAVAQQAVKKPKKSMSAGTFLRIVGAILLVALIFFGAFLSYIVFNPGQAQFFISFGINPGDIARLLRQLVSAIF